MQSSNWRSRAGRCSLSHPSGAAMPNEDNKSGEQNAAEGEVEGLTRGHSSSMSNRHGCRWCPRSRSSTEVSYFVCTMAIAAAGSEDGIQPQQRHPEDGPSLSDQKVVHPHREQWALSCGG
jgi:hypothetical protein